MRPHLQWLLLSAILGGTGVASGAPGSVPVMTGQCQGRRVPIETVLARRECERCGPPQPKRLARELESRLVLSAPRVAPGGTVTLRAVLRNRGQTRLELPFVWHSGPLHVVAVEDAKGRPVPVEGTPPPVGPAGYRPGPPYQVCLRIEPGGEAYVERGWAAVRLRWTRQPRLPSGAPVSETAGPLPRGRYRLRLQTMLQDPALGAPAATIEVR